MAETLFNLLNILPLPIWLSMLLFPRARFTQKMVLSYWPYIALAGVYLLFLVAAVIESQSGGFDLSYTALKANLSADWVFLSAWAHFVTLDLFVGVWIFRDAKYWGINPGFFLLATLFLAPLGLGGYLLLRERKNKRDPVRVLN